MYDFCVDARSCSLREAINMAAFEEHVSSLHADGDYQLSQEYEVKLFSCLHKNVQMYSVLSVVDVKQSVMRWK